MEKNYLVLGATGSIGYAFTQELLSRGKSVSIFVRNKEKAKQLFKNYETLNIIEGDVNDLQLLKKAAENADVIFHGINYPYQLWDKYMKPLTQNIIEAAKQKEAVILFPGNIYAYGNSKEKITEESIAKPTGKKGVLRLELEQLLKQASEKGACKTIVLRLPDFYGPNVTNGLIKPIFGNAAKGKPINWLINADIPHQFVYTPDAAKILMLLAEESNLPKYIEYNYGGEVVPSIRLWAAEINKIAGNRKKVIVMSKVMLNIASWFILVVKELKENFYQFENTVLLDDSKLKEKYNDFKVTKTEDALRETIEWWQSYVN